jgi:hypothetical protein
MVQSRIQPIPSSLPTPPASVRFIATCPTCPWTSEPREYTDSLAALKAADRHNQTEAHMLAMAAPDPEGVLGYDQMCKDCGVAHYPTEPCAASAWDGDE